MFDLFVDKITGQHGIIQHIIIIYIGGKIILNNDQIYHMMWFITNTKCKFTAKFDQGY